MNLLTVLWILVDVKLVTVKNVNSWRKSSRFLPVAHFTCFTFLFYVFVCFSDFLFSAHVLQLFVNNV